ncbi:MAG: MFS transporter, partial [Dehalococcoidia bacterium]|nr:MFS transporter [Dehalococcoidia bacterium]
MWAGLVAAAAGMFLTALDITVNVALPEITENLGTDLETIQWIIILYVGSTTGMGLGLGGAGDVYGLKR